MHRCLLALGLLSCSSGPPSVIGAPAAGGAEGTDENAPIAFSDDERALIAAMSPEVPPAPFPDPSNRYDDDPRAIDLGKRFFNDPRFSGRLLDGDNNPEEVAAGRALGLHGESGKVACAGCHIADGGFVDVRSLRQQISLGAGWTSRRAQTLIGVGASRFFGWDGRSDSLWQQALQPLENPVEMNSSRLFVAQQVSRYYKEEYEAIFGPLPRLDDTSRFPELSEDTVGCVLPPKTAISECGSHLHGVPGDGDQYDGMTVEDQSAVTQVAVNWGKALSAFQRRLSCGPGRFDAWAHGDKEALTLSEQRGLQVFLGEGQCANCHSGPFLSDFLFHNVGMRASLVATVFITPNDPGAQPATQALIDDPLNSHGVFSDGVTGSLPEVTAALLGAFKTPSLRCVSRRPSFMRTGQFYSLEDVVEFFDSGGHSGGFVGTKVIEPLALSDDDKRDLVAFLHTLDGEILVP